MDGSMIDGVRRAGKWYGHRHTENSCDDPSQHIYVCFLAIF